MNAAQKLVGPDRLFYGWRVIAAAGVMRFLAGGLHLFGFSIFFLPVSRDLDLSRAATSLVFSLARLEGAFEGPVAGYLIDRFGPRVIMLIGTLLAGVGYLFFSQSWNFPTLLLAYVLVITPGAGAGFMHATLALANNWFIRRRAMSMSLMSSAVPLGGALLTPLLAGAVYLLGWRGAALAVGVVFLVVALPVARTVRDTPESLGLVPDGQPAKPDPAGSLTLSSEARGQHRDHSVREAMRTPAFWVLVLGIVLRSAGFSAIMVHFVPLLVWKGLEERTAALYVAPMSLLSVGAHLFSGWLADRWPKPRILALGMTSGTVALLVLLYGGTATLWLFLLLFVWVEAGFPVTWATVGDFFGRRHFASVRGFITMFVMLGPVAAPVFAGRVYDTTGGYTLALQVFIIFFSLSAVVFWMLRPPKLSPLHS